MCVLRRIKCMGLINTAAISLVYYSQWEIVSTEMRSWNPNVSRLNVASTIVLSAFMKRLVKLLMLEILLGKSSLAHGISDSEFSPTHFLFRYHITLCTDCDLVRIAVCRGDSQALLFLSKSSERIQNLTSVIRIKVIRSTFPT